MPSGQQKFAKKGSERYLMSGPNHILATLRWDDGRSLCHENFCWWFLNRYWVHQEQEIMCFLENV